MNKNLRLEQLRNRLSRIKREMVRFEAERVERSVFGMSLKEAEQFEKLAQEEKQVYFEIEQMYKP